MPTVVATATANNVFQGQPVGPIFYLFPTQDNDRNAWDIHLAANVTITPTGWPPHQRADVIVMLRQPTGGSWTATFASSVTGTPTQPTPTVPVLVHLISSDGSTWFVD